MARMNVGAYGPESGYDVGDLARRKFVDVIRQKSGLWSGDRLLDVACGSGVLSHGLARAFTKARIVGVEADEELLERAVENAGRERLTAERLALVQAEPDALPFGEETFLVTTCALGLSRAEDPLAVLEEMHRVTEFGGKCLLVDVDVSRLPRPPGDVAPNVLDEDLFEAMKEMGWGKIVSQRLSLLRGGAVLRLVSAKRHDPEGAEPGPEGDEEEEEWDDGEE